ncbi:MAG: CPBP family intramembrane metalloprotease [Acidimicrobiia bacterium]|nr:CPBP family intramembrane metalloprotease [Acidimicrobiia bacterium]
MDTLAPAATSTVPPPVAPRPYRWPAVLALNFAPGLITVATVLALHPAARSLGLPPIVPYTVAIAVVTPLELGYLLWYGRRASGRWSIRPAIDLTSHLPKGRVLLTTAGFVLGTAVLAVALGPIASAIDSGTSSWFPSYLSPDITDAAIAHYGQLALVLALAANLVVDAIVNPVVEELYWKGHLMGRIPLAGMGPVIATGVLFSAEHFWQPADFLLVALVQVALCWHARRRNTLDVAIATHWVVNGLVTIASIVAVLAH